MKLPTTELQGIGTTGATGIVLMTLHIFRIFNRVGMAYTLCYFDFDGHWTRTWCCKK